MRVPLLLVTGFLGSGKTTLLNRLLAQRAEAGARGKIGVIVNELGEVGIDGALLGGATSRQIELPGGCVCCVLGDDLDRTLIDLLEANPELEAIVLETTGVAEPLPIAWALQREPVVDRVRLAAVITLVDATRFRASRPLSVAVDAQVAYADVVLVTKSELVDAPELAAVESDVRTLASRALLRIGGTDAHVAWLDSVLEDPEIERVASDEAPPGDQDPDHVHGDECRHLDNRPLRAAHGIDSVSIAVHGVVELEELEDQLADLPANYVRIKGILQAVDGRRGSSEKFWVAVHRVGPRVSSEPIEAPSFTREEPALREEGRIVALGAGVDAEALRACVAAALRENLGRGPA